jgi:transcriptional regulatory protein RtcR
MPAERPVVALGLLGTTLDRGAGAERWSRWRPTVALGQQEDIALARFDLLFPVRERKLAESVSADLRSQSPNTEVVLHPLDLPDPWDFEAVYAALFDFARAYPFDPDAHDYLLHITTGTHVAQICLFLLAESRHIPARLVQTSPARTPAGRTSIIDLGLARYDRIFRRFEEERVAATAFLKGGIATRNVAFNTLIDRIELVALRSTSPMLLTGPTGAGKSRLARRIWELKRARRLVTGPLVELNCATLRGDGAMSALFGHRRGAFTGAMADRAGLLREAHGGVLFLDEIGELGLDEQATLLRALEERRFLPVGADKEVESDFQLLAGTNRDLAAAVREGRFREDLLARIDLWSFQLPGLAERPEDIEPNVDHELGELTRTTGQNVTFNREARARFLNFAERAPWPRNFRELGGALTRLATLSAGRRIGLAEVDEEITRLRRSWRPGEGADPVAAVLGDVELDRFDRVQLNEVIRVCRASASLSDAGRALFGVSRGQKRSVNDADRLRKYLARFGLDWTRLRVG